MSGQLFISYRRRANAWAVGHLHERLLGEFGREQVFFDTDTLQAGEGWLKAIHEAIASASAVVAVFCSEWYGRKADGSRRIDAPDDPVRIELLQAHAAGIPIVPVVIDQAREPTAADLPQALQFLSTLHFRRLDPTDSIDRQVNRLISDIRQAIYGTRPWMRIVTQSLWMGLLAGILAGGLEKAGLAAPFQDAFAATVQTLRALRHADTASELALVEITDDEYRELYGGRLPLDPGVMAIAVRALARLSEAADSCHVDRPVGINLDLSPGEAFANNQDVAALELALAQLAACRPVVLACPQSVERGTAREGNADLAWRSRLGAPPSGRGVLFASTLIDPTVLRYSRGRVELGVMVGDIAAGRDAADLAAEHRCACPADAETMRDCRADGSGGSTAAEAFLWDRRSMVVPFVTSQLPYSLADALLADTAVMAHRVVMIGGAFGAQGRYSVNGLAAVAPRGVTGTQVHRFLVASTIQHTPVRWPSAAVLGCDIVAAALACLGVTLCWWMVSLNAHRFSRRAAGYLGVLTLALGMPLACVAAAVVWPAWSWLASALALAFMVASVRSAVAGTELLLHGGVAWKSTRGLWQALFNEADRGSALMRLAVRAVEALLIALVGGAVLLA